MGQVKNSNNPERFNEVYEHDESDLDRINGVRIAKYKGKTYFSCLGLTSKVVMTEAIFTNRINDYTHFYNHGHVLLADMEDCSYLEVKEMANDLFDCYAILRSSKKDGRENYHLINPVVRPRTETRDILQSISKTYLGCNPYSLEDRSHCHIGYLRGDWVLRISEKPSKDAPVLIDSNIESCLNIEDSKYFSYPHLRYLRDVYQIDIKDIIRKNKVIGQKLQTVKYYTYK